MSIAPQAVPTDTAPTPRLRVWHIPQVPGPPFVVEVATVEEGRKVQDILADYDLFQYEHRVKPDYSNASGLEVWDDGEWCEYDADFDGAA